MTWKYYIITIEESKNKEINQHFTFKINKILSSFFQVIPETFYKVIEGIPNQESYNKGNIE